MTRTIWLTVLTIGCFSDFNVAASAFGQTTNELELAISAVPDDLKSDRDRALSALESYRRREQTLTKQIDGELTKLEGRLKADRQLPPAQRAAYQAEIDSARRWLNNGGSVATCEITLPVVTQAARKSVQLRRPLDRSIGLLIRKLEAAELIGLATNVREKLVLVGGPLNALNSITPGMVFKGFRQQEGQTTQKTLRFTLGTKEGNREFGKVEAGWQYAGHPHQELLWQISGLNFVATTGKGLKPGHGPDQSLRYEGLFIGNVIAGKYAGKSLRGKPVSGTFRVEVE